MTEHLRNIIWLNPWNIWFVNNKLSAKGGGLLTINEGRYGVCIIDMSFTAQRYLFCKYFDFFNAKCWNSLTKCRGISVLLVYFFYPITTSSTIVGIIQTICHIYIWVFFVKYLFLMTLRIWWFLLWLLFLHSEKNRIYTTDSCVHAVYIKVL